MPANSVQGKMRGRTSNGGATWLPQLSEAFFSVQGYEFYWITFDKNLRKPLIEKVGNQWYIRLPIWKHSIYVYCRHYIPRWKLNKWVKIIDPDLVHAWGTEHFYGSVFKGLNLPKILSIQGLLTEFKKVADMGKLLNIQAKIEPLRIREADIVTCESEWSMEGVKKIERNADVRIVDYGVHSSFFSIRWKPEEDNPYLVYVGSLDHRKGTDILLESLRRTPRRTWKCVIIGSGPMAKDVKNANLENVEYRGMLEWEEMQNILSEAWGLIIPTRADTGPTVVKEARVIGLPVIGSVHGGLRDYIQHGENGFLVDPLDSAGLSEACSRLTGNYDKCLNMGHSLHNEDRTRFDPKGTASKFLNIYKEMLSL